MKEEKMVKFFNAKRQGGFTLVQLMLTVLAVAVITALGYSQYSDIMGNTKASAAIEHRTTIAAGIRGNLGNENGYGALDTDGSQLMIDLEAVPSSLVVGSTVKNEFGGTYTFGSSDGGVSGGDANAYFTITTDKNPQSVCIKAASGSVDDWQTISVNGTEVDGSVDDARDQCVDGENTLVFTGH